MITRKSPTIINKKNEFGLPDIGIPAEILFHPDFTPTEKLLFGFIRNLSQSEKGCWASNKWLGRLLGVGTQTISNCIAKLKDAGYLLVEYENLSDGKCIRRIFINPEYPLIYREMVQKWHENPGNSLWKNKGPLLKNLYTPIKKVIGPYKKSYNKEEIKEEKKIKDIFVAYIPIAEKLSQIISTKKNVRHTPSQIETWAKALHKFAKYTLIGSETENKKRIKRALHWYASHIGEQYVPVIESGRSFVEKFGKLESAIERSNEFKNSHGNYLPPKKEGAENKYNKVKIIKIEGSQ